jgi:G3E family GTPase
VDEDVSQRARLDAVVTVADARWLSERLKDAPEAKNQIAFADVILLNKTDLVDEAGLKSVEAQIRAINPSATIHRTVNCNVPIAEVLDRKAFDLDRIMEVEPDFLEEGHHHHHDEEMRSFSFRAGEVNPDKFMPWISELTQREGPQILRCKGIVAFPKEPKRFVFQGVHMILDGGLSREWRPGEKRESRVVFIGRDLDEARYREGFMACAA